MFCLIFILLCCGAGFSYSQVDISAAIVEEIHKQVSPLWTKYAEVEAINLQKQKTITNLQNQIRELKKDINVLKSSEIVANQRLQQLASIPRGETQSSDDICDYVSTQCPTKSRQGRQVISQLVSFSAVMDHQGGNNHDGNTLIFNQLISSSYGNGYNTSTGYFTAPNNSLYAFFWVIQVRHNSWCSTRFLRNGLIMSVTSSNAKATGSGTNEGGSGSGFLLVYMIQGDIAYIQMNTPPGHTCDIVSNGIMGRSTFSGWEVAKDDTI